MNAHEYMREWIITGAVSEFTEGDLPMEYHDRGKHLVKDIYRGFQKAVRLHYLQIVAGDEDQQKLQWEIQDVNLSVMRSLWAKLWEGLTGLMECMEEVGAKSYNLFKIQQSLDHLKKGLPDDYNEAFRITDFMRDATHHSLELRQYFGFTKPQMDDLSNVRVPDFEDEMMSPMEIVRGIKSELRKIVMGPIIGRFASMFS